MRRADAASWNIDRLDGVVRSFQVIEYKVEPSEAVLARYLLTNDESRSTGSDESEPLGPEVSIIGKAEATTRLRERLTRARAGPHIDVVGPPDIAQGSTPDSDAAEEVTLSIAGNVGRLQVSDGSLIDDSLGQLSGLDQVARPLRGVCVGVIVEGRRQRLLEHELAAPDAKEARGRAVVAHVDRQVARHHRRGRARRRGQPRPCQRGDLASLEGPRRDLAQDLGDHGERAHAATSALTRRARRASPSTIRRVSIDDPTSTWSLRKRASAAHTSA